MTQSRFLVVMRRWWRPTLAWSAALAVCVNGVVLPLYLRRVENLEGLALVITATAALYGIREWGKTKGLE